MRRYLFFAAIAVAAVGAFFRVPLWVGLVVAGALVLTWVAYGLAVGWFQELGQPHHHHHHGRPRDASDWPLVFAVKPRTKAAEDASPDKKPEEPTDRRSAS